VMANSAVISLYLTSILMVISFSVILKRQMLTTGYTRMMALL
jgi:hypothetical protein